MDDLFQFLTTGGFTSPLAILGYCIVTKALIQGTLGVRMRYEKGKDKDKFGG